MKTECSLELYDILMIQLSKVFNISLFLISNFFHSYGGVFIFSAEHSSLCSGAEPLQIADHFECDFPFVFWKRNV